MNNYNKMLKSRMMEMEMEDEGEEVCNMKLSLGLGLFGEECVQNNISSSNVNNSSCLSLALINPKQELGMINMMQQQQQQQINMIHPNSSSSIFNNHKTKLRLSKQQSTLLEQTFKLHTTLNPAHKQALAQQLNLKTRQVEVWFQNRRARTKLKQTEVDCEFLKKCCERLNEENRRMKKELNELRSIKHGASQFYIQLPKTATLTICPSCDKITTAAAANAAVDHNSPPS